MVSKAEKRQTVTGAMGSKPRVLESAGEGMAHEQLSMKSELPQPWGPLQYLLRTVKSFDPAVVGLTILVNLGGACIWEVMGECSQARVSNRIRRL